MKVTVKVNESPKAFKEIAINANDFMFGNVYYSYNEHNPKRYYKYIRTAEKASPLDNTNSVEDTYAYAFDGLCSEEESEFVYELDTICSSIATLKSHGNADKFEMMLNKIHEIIDEALTDEFGTDKASSEFLDSLKEFMSKDYDDIIDNTNVSKEKVDTVIGMAVLINDIAKTLNSRKQSPSRSDVSTSSDKNTVKENLQFMVGPFHFTINDDKSKECNNTQHKHFVRTVTAKNIGNNDVSTVCICRKDTDNPDDNIYHTEVRAALSVISGMIMDHMNVTKPKYLYFNSYSIESEENATLFALYCTLIDLIGDYTVYNNMDQYMPIFKQILNTYSTTLSKGV